MKHKNGFTLIEILVVISILAGFITMLVPNFMAARIKSRDSKRKSDLRQIQKALELYRQDQIPQVYPTDLPSACEAWKNADSSVVYMNSVPGDPMTSCASSTGQTSYYYLRDPSDTMKYVLYACLEDKADPEKVECPASDFVCATSSTNCYKLIEP